MNKFLVLSKSAFDSSPTGRKVLPIGVVAGKGKLIYIDPPYNTGNDFVYDDDYAETADEYLLRVPGRIDRP